jgi:hypothetical protein
VGSRLAGGISAQMNSAKMNSLVRPELWSHWDLIYWALMLSYMVCICIYIYME